MEFLGRSKETSELFDTWMTNYPDGYVVSVRGNEAMLHLASCGHFKFQEWKNSTYSPKVISHDRAELDEWAKRQEGKHYSVCRDCKP